jgi:hypothetical protein
MTDIQIRGEIIQSLYRIRREGQVPITPDRLGLELAPSELLRVAHQLLQSGLIEGPFQKNYGLEQGDFTFAMANLTATGINVAEGESFPSLKIEFMTLINNNSNNTHVTGSTGVTVGSNNQQTIQISLLEIAKLIENSSSSEQQKADAKSRLRSFLEHPVSGAVLGAAASAALAALR